MRLYRIKDWETHFENAESRKIKHLRWVAVPNKHDGKGYRRMVRHERACEIFAAWSLIVQVASKMPTRGVLADSDGPLTAEDLADATGFPEAIFVLAFNILSEQKIGWICYEETPGFPGPSGRVRMASGEEGAEGEGREGKGTLSVPLPGDGAVDADGHPAFAPDGATVVASSRRKPADEEDEGDAVAACGQPAAHAGDEGAAVKQPAENVPPGFAAFWTAWPKHFRKKGRSKCLLRWKTKKLESMAATIVSAVERCKSSRQWLREGGQYIPMPLSWLSDESWEADVDSEPSESDDASDSPGFVRGPKPSDALLRSLYPDARIDP